MVRDFVPQQYDSNDHLGRGVVHPEASASPRIEAKYQELDSSSLWGV